MSIEQMNLDLLWQDITEVKAMSSRCPVSFSPDLPSRAVLETFYHQPDAFIGRQCRDVFKNMMIKSDGSVIPAHGRCYNLSVGNLYTSSLADIWNSTTFEEFRRDLIDAGGFFPACSRCCSAFSQ